MIVGLIETYKNKETFLYRGIYTRPTRNIIMIISNCRNSKCIEEWHASFSLSKVNFLPGMVNSLARLSRLYICHPHFRARAKANSQGKSQPHACHAVTVLRNYHHYKVPSLSLCLSLSLSLSLVYLLTNLDKRCFRGRLIWNDVLYKQELRNENGR